MSRTLPIDTKILLESGTNEVEILVFQVGRLLLGINVAKVREVLRVPQMTQLPMTDASMHGCFRLRDVVVPCLSLHKLLNEEPTHQTTDAVVILTEFNQFQLGFLVDVVERIHRTSWNHVLPVPTIISNCNAPVTAITRIEDRLVTMLDFETIASHLEEQKSPQEPGAHQAGVSRVDRRVAIADDSPTARNAIAKVMRQNGYKSLFVFDNGEALWTWLSSQTAAGELSSSPVDLVITDVEMPVTDGFHLTRRIKQDQRFKNIPVLLYSSILTPDNWKKGQSVGADAQITKPELHRVVTVADDLIRQAQKCGAGDASISA